MADTDRGLLRLVHLEAGYGPTSGLHDVTLEVRPGEIVALLGANGAGKTTLLMAISGLVAIRNGVITCDGHVLNRLSPRAIVARGISHVPEGRRILPRLSVLENLMLGAALRHDRAAIAQDAAQWFELFPILAERRRQLAGTLSGGEQQMLAIARGLMARPKLLLLDEPSLGLSPKLVSTLFETIRGINQRGVTVLLVEQNAYQALTIAHRGYVLETGHVVLTGTVAALANNPHVKSAYLGG